MSGCACTLYFYIVECRFSSYSKYFSCFYLFWSNTIALLFSRVVTKRENMKGRRPSWKWLTHEVNYFNHWRAEFVGIKRKYSCIPQYREGTDHWSQPSQRKRIRFFVKSLLWFSVMDCFEDTGNGHLQLLSFIGSGLGHRWFKYHY